MRHATGQKTRSDDTFERPGDEACPGNYSKVRERATAKWPVH